MRPFLAPLAIITAAFVIALLTRLGRSASRAPAAGSSVNRLRGVHVLGARVGRALTRVRRHPSPSRWPVALRLMAREIRSGAALDRAMEIAAGAEPALVSLTQVVEQRRIGWRTSAPLDDDVHAVVTADDRLALTTIAHLTEHGGQIAASLDRAAATIHEREVKRSEREVQAAQARISAQLLSVIAPLFAGWSAVSDARVRHFLLGTIPGLLCLLIGIALNLAGYAWMGHVVRQP